MTGAAPLSADDGIAAGDFASWLAEIEHAIRTDGTSDVPCGTCIACCTSSQFVHISPDETATLDRIPRQLLFPAPGAGRGHLLLGYDEAGRCPMLVEGRCSIYESRPRTCRTYDCRVFPASGLAPEDKAAIARQVRRWRFDFTTDADRARHDAVVSAARFLSERADQLLPGSIPPNATQRAALAIEIHRLFLDLHGAGGPSGAGEPDAHLVSVELRRRRR